MKDPARTLQFLQCTVYDDWEIYHQKGSNKPVHHDAERNLDPDLASAEDVMETFVFDLAQDGIHHDQ